MDGVIIRSQPPVGSAIIATQITELESVVSRLTCRVTIAKFSHAGVFRARAHADQSALSVGRILGDDVDDTIYRVGAPKRATRSPDDFNTFDALQLNIQRFPHDAREEGGVGTPAINKHQQFAGIAPAKAAHRNRPRIVVYGTHMDPRHHA